MSSNVKTAVFWVVIITAIAVVYMAIKSSRGAPPRNLSASDFVNYIQDGKIKDAVITGTDVQGKLADGVGGTTEFHTVIPPNWQTSTR
jgi:cell division protease FtsH